MEIKHSGRLNNAGETGAAKGATRTPSDSSQRPEQEQSATPPATDRVTLTAAAQLLISQGSPDAGAPVDRARVEALRTAIADGSYEMDAGRIAERLISTDNDR